MNKLHFFIEEQSGKLMVFTDMPEEPKDKCEHYSGFACGDNYSCPCVNEYQSALKAAKEKALEVVNKDEVLDKLWRSDERINGPIPFLHWKENMLPYPKDTTYSLDCNIEVKNHCTNKHYISGCANETCWDLEECQAKVQVALITFSESKPMDEEKYLLIEVFADNGEHTHYALIESTTGIKVWSEDPAECKAQGHPVVPPLPVEDKLSKIIEYVDGSKIAERFKGLTIPVIEYNEAIAVLRGKVLPVEDKEEQENLWKLALHHAGSRMDFMKFLTDQFVIKPRKQLE
jgi:hypothetical protein